MCYPSLTVDCVCRPSSKVSNRYLASRGYSICFRHIDSYICCSQTTPPNPDNNSTESYSSIVVAITIPLFAHNNAFPIRYINDVRRFVPSIARSYDHSDSFFSVGSQTDHDGEKPCPDQDVCSRSFTKVTHDMQCASICFVLHRSRARSSTRISRIGEKRYRIERKLGIG